MFHTRWEMFHTRILERLRPIRSLWRDYLDLTRPVVSAVVLLNALTVMLVSSDGLPQIANTIILLVGGLLAAGSANALSSCLDADLDALMTRTADRPLPAGRLELGRSINYGMVLAGIACLVLGIGINLLAGLLTLLAIVFQVVVYTHWLKRRSPYSVLAGAVPGAMASLIGWVAARGRLEPEAFLFFAIIYCWTPTHFWSLALALRNEYLRAGIPALPVVYGPQPTRIQVGRFAVLAVMLSFLPVGFGLLKSFYALAAMLLGGFFIYYAASMLAEPGLRSSWRLYKYTSQYLGLLLAAMVLDWVFYF